jgi:hypothetical protein
MSILQLRGDYIECSPNSAVGIVTRLQAIGLSICGSFPKVGHKVGLHEASRPAVWSTKPLVQLPTWERTEFICFLARINIPLLHFCVLRNQQSPARSKPPLSDTDSFIVTESNLWCDNLLIYVNLYWWNSWCWKCPIPCYSPFLGALQRILHVTAC